ncbi:MAG: hypothetical protein JXR70_07235 [Spirochaetales bacterium]|nr:hypothetical protein [Spirochaetales bacterium]
MIKVYLFTILTYLFLMNSCENSSDLALYKKSGVVFDRIMLIEADEEGGFLCPYLLYIPDKLKTMAAPAKILVIPNNSGKTNDSDDWHLTRAIEDMKRYSLPADQENQRVILMPVFPRYSSINGGYKIYTHALDRDSLVSPLAKGKIERIDVQLINMLNHARNLLAAEAGISFDFRVIMFGFSASAHFADRFTLLYPRQVQALVIGGFNGHIALPLAQYNGMDLIYPVGIYDYAELTESAFDYQSYKAIPKLFFMGAHDTNDDVSFSDGYDEPERKLIYALLGEVRKNDFVSQRIAPLKAILEEQGLMENRIFKIYENTGHEISSAMIKDIEKFMNEAHMDEVDY